MGKKVFIDIDIDGSREAYVRATEFVSTSSIKYGLSSDDVTQLGGREIKELPDIYSSDYEWSAKGRCLAKPQPVTRIIIELHDDVPLATENFLHLCRFATSASCLLLVC